ncbi:MAG: hypothetical protein LIO97_05325 [Tannerellaceae bacterium]|nr:hypothetical protein [Tannerellaceae bacterium]
MNLKQKLLSAVMTGGLLAFTITIPLATAQNIVTIFGQEKVEKTDEGEVFHHFRNGLMLPGMVNPGTFV